MKVTWIGTQLFNALSRLMGSAEGRSRFTKFVAAMAKDAAGIPKNLASPQAIFRYIKQQPLDVAKNLTKTALLTAGLTLAGDEVEALIDAMYLDESAASDGTIDMIATIVSDTRSLEEESTQHALKMAYPSLPDVVDDQMGEETKVTAKDVAAFLAKKSEGERIMQSFQAKDMALALNVIAPAKERLRRASAITGLSQERVIELAELLHEINGSYRVLL